MTGFETPPSRILLVDDEEAIRDNVGAYLLRSGFDVQTAADGEQALQVLDGDLPDLVVLDVVMPKVDGREVLRRLRHGNVWVPIVLLTQVGESYERAAALEEGADDYLNKPFDPQELVARIRAILRRTARGEPSLAGATSLVSRGLRIDRAARRLWVGGEETAVTPKAFALLEYLMSHPDEVLGRDRLLAQVWGFDFPVTSRAIDHRIVELRKVLEAGAREGSVIETVPGIGYRFVDAVRPA